MKKLLVLIALAGTLQSCITYEDVEVKGVENYNVENLLNKNEDLKLLLDLKIENPNNYKITIKDADLHLYIGNKDLGRVTLGRPVKIPKKSTTVQTLEIKPDSRKMLMAAMGGAAGALLKGEIDVRLKGKVKGKALGIGKWFDIDHKETINLKGKLFISPEK